MEESDRILNVNDEYLLSFRTKSYADLFMKAQSQINQPTSSPSCRRCRVSEVLLDPGQESISAVLESIFFPNKSYDDHLKSLLLNYFDVGAQASRFCSQLLRSLIQVQSDYIFLDDDHASNHEELDSTYSGLRSCVIFKNPFSDINKQDFRRIHENTSSSVLKNLKSKRKKVARKIKLIKFFNKASGFCVAAACGLIEAATVALTVHTLTVQVVGPALPFMPIKSLKKKIVSIRFLKYDFLRKIGQQLDLAAKGTYILNRDFDTISRLVDRLQHEIEHNEKMIQFCSDRSLSFQILKELKKFELGLMKQVEELEEHVYLCLLTINRGRALAIKGISSPL